MSLIHFLTLLVIIMHTESNIDKRVITTLKYSRGRVVPTVVNGDVAGDGQIPYIVSIKEPSQKIANFRLWINLCGGSIIGKSKVLTAGHCFEMNTFYYYRNPHLLRLVAGNLSTDVFYDGTTANIWDTQWRSIKKLAIHKHFNFPVNDLAVIIIDKEWDFKDGVNFVLTAKGNRDYQRVCLTAGFGNVGHGPRDKPSQVLLMGRISLLTRKQCTNLWEMNMDNYVCTTSALSDVSQGDSGGPLTCVDKKGKDVLVGVVSGKNFDTTTLFTRVSVYRDWIGRNFASDLRTDISFLVLVSVMMLF